MVVTVVITGMPRLMSLKNLAVELNEVLENDELGDFRIRDIVTNNKNKRQVALDFESGFDAMTVQEKLDGFEFITSGGSCNFIKAKILTGAAQEEPVPSTEVVISTTSKQDYYEPTIEHGNVSLEEQIEILKKQTLAIKAQRKFLREQKKLKKEYKNLEIDSENEISKTKKRRKRKRSKTPDSDSSADDNRKKSREEHTRKSYDRSKRSKSTISEDYLAIEYKKISSTRKSLSPETRKDRRSAARSKSREKLPHKTETHKRRSRSRSRDKYCAVEYKKSTRSRRTSSPSPHSSRRGVVRSKSRERRIPETQKRRSKSRSRERYYSVETIQYKKSLVTKKRSSISRSRYESSERCVMSSKSSKFGPCSPPHNKSSRLSPSSHKRDLSSKFDSRRRKTSRSRSRSNSPFKCKSMTLEGIDSRVNKLRSSSPEKITSSKKSTTKPESSEFIGSKHRTSKGSRTKSRDQEEQTNIDAEIQSKKKQAMEDVLFEMELLLSKEKDTISSADKAFLSQLVKEIIKSRFQKLEVHNRMMVSDVVTRYRSQYSREDDKALLQYLAGECKSLDKSTSIIVADSTAEVSIPQIQNDEIWTAVDEVLDGVDLDLLQGEPDTNEVEISENLEEPQTCYAEETISKCVAIKSKKNIHNETENVHKNQIVLSCNMDSSNDDITSSGIDMSNTKTPVRNNTTDLTKVSKTSHGNNTKVENNVNIETVELSDVSDDENNEQTKVTSTMNKEDPTSDNSTWAGQIVQVISLAQVEKPTQNITATVVKKEKVAMIDLTDDSELNDDQAITASSRANLINYIKEEYEPDTIDSTADPNQIDINNLRCTNVLSHTNSSLLNCIKQEKIDIVSFDPTDSDRPITHEDPIGVISIKKEKTDKDEVQNVSSFSSTPILLCSMKQEPETNNSPCNPNPSQICSEQSPHTTLVFNTLVSIKKENETSYSNPDITGLNSYVMREDVVTANLNSQLKMTENNDQINMPIPIISNHIKQECVTTNNLPAITASETPDKMPLPIDPSCIKQENEAILNNCNRSSKTTGNNHDKEHVSADKSDSREKSKKHETREIMIDTPETSRSRQKSKHETKDRSEKTEDKDIVKKSRHSKTEKTESCTRHKDQVDNLRNNKDTRKKDSSGHKVIKTFDAIPDIPDQTAADKLPSNTEQTPEIVERDVPANPRFVIPIHVAMKPMKTLIKNEYKDHKYISQITHKVLHNRFKELVKGKGYLKANYIIKMYKERYAEEKYKDFLNSIVADINTGKYDEDIKIIDMKQKKKKNS